MAITERSLAPRISATSSELQQSTAAVMAALRLLVGDAVAREPRLVDELHVAFNAAFPRAEQAEPARAPTSDPLLTIDEAAGLLGVSPSWLYHHWREMGCGRKLPGGALRFSRAALLSWVDSRPDR